MYFHYSLVWPQLRLQKNLLPEMGPVICISVFEFAYGNNPIRLYLYTTMCNLKHVPVFVNLKIPETFFNGLGRLSLQRKQE